MPDEAKVERSGVGLTEAVGKWVAVIGSVVAVGQAAATWVSGYWQAEAQKEKSAQELRLAELKDRSGLAADYLKLILSKDTAEPDRVSFLDALSKIEGHPLQAWASARTKAYQSQITRLFETFKAQNDAVQKRAGIDRDVAVLTADIERLNEEILIHKDDEAKRNQLQAELVSKSADLGRLKGTQTLAVVKVEETATLITRSEQSVGAVAAPQRGLAETISSVTEKVDAALLMTVFPDSARARVQANAPFLRAALQEFRITDKRLIASLIATILVEDPTFADYEEPEKDASRYEGRADLGNTQPGDGVRYRGRGYVGITGRANYARYSARLGLGTRLLDSPEDAKSPEVASRVTVAFFADRQAQLGAALANDDLAPARRAVAGSTRQLDQFTTAYRKLLAGLG